MIEIEELRHERDLIQGHAQEPGDEINEEALGKSSATIDVALPRSVREIHHLRVFGATLESARQPTGDRPETMSRDIGMPRHGVTHQATDAAVSIRERMDVVEPMMSGGCRDDPARPAHAVESIPLPEVAHEVVDSRAGWRLMPADRDVLFRSRSPFTRRHRERSTNASDPQHRPGSISIEFAMQ